MKATELLRWIVNESVSTEPMDFVTIDEHFSFERYFGYVPEKPVPMGDYLYLYSDCVPVNALDRLPDLEEQYQITTDFTDRSNGGLVFIYLFKLDES